jgi:hypothetical protein
VFEKLDSEQLKKVQSAMTVAKRIMARPSPPDPHQGALCGAPPPR